MIDATLIKIAWIFSDIDIFYSFIPQIRAIENLLRIIYFAESILYFQYSQIRFCVLSL